MNRKEVLDAACQCVSVDREKQYGPPEDNFSRIAQHWSIYKGVEFTAHDVAMMMVYLKTSRVESGQIKDDNYVDACGYLACAGEIATKQQEGQA